MPDVPNFDGEHHPEWRYFDKEMHQHMVKVVHFFFTEDGTDRCVYCGEPDDRRQHRLREDFDDLVKRQLSPTALKILLFNEVLILQHNSQAAYAQLKDLRERIEFLEDHNGIGS